MHIAFLSLFLGLVSGQQQVRLTASAQIAAIELQLDGVAVAHLAAPPWQSGVDLGPDLLPHQLVARGLDGAGREVARADQWINLRHQNAAVALAFEQAAAGLPRSVHLSWQNVTNEPPRSIALTLDGKPLPLDAEHRAVLPPHLDPKATAVLSAELRFANNTVARRDVALGGEFGDQVAAELMAVPVWAHAPGDWKPERFAGWLAATGPTAGAGDLQVDAVDAGRPEILVVRDPAVQRALAQPPWYVTRTRTQMAQGCELRMVASAVHRVAGVTPFNLFDVSRPFFFSRSFDLGSFLVKIFNADERIGAPQQTADAVAVAGLHASSTGRRRAVLLVLAKGGGADQSTYRPAAVRRYLAALHVPLLVWSAGAPTAADRAAWGDVEDFSTVPGLDRAFTALQKRLEDQRIVWVEGLRLPQTIALSPAAAAAGIALDPPPP